MSAFRSKDPFAPGNDCSRCSREPGTYRMGHACWTELAAGAFPAGASECIGFTLATVAVRSFELLMFLVELAQDDDEDDITARVSRLETN